MTWRAGVLAAVVAGAALAGGAAAAAEPAPEGTPDPHLLEEILARQEAAARPPGIYVPGPASPVGGAVVPAMPTPARDSGFPVAAGLEALAVLVAGASGAVAVYRWRQDAAARVAYRERHPDAGRVAVALRR